MKGKKGIGKGKNPPIGQGPPRHHPPPPPSGRWSWEADDDDWGYDWGGGEAHHSECAPGDRLVKDLYVKPVRISGNGWEWEWVWVICVVGRESSILNGCIFP